MRTASVVFRPRDEEVTPGFVGSGNAFRDRQERARRGRAIEECAAQGRAPRARRSARALLRVHEIPVRRADDFIHFLKNDRRHPVYVQHDGVTLCCVGPARIHHADRAAGPRRTVVRSRIDGIDHIAGVVGYP